MLLDNTIIQWGKKRRIPDGWGYNDPCIAYIHTQSPIFGVRESFFFHFFSL